VRVKKKTRPSDKKTFIRQKSRQHNENLNLFTYSPFKTNKFTKN